jgi:hypothetical protein
MNTFGRAGLECTTQKMQKGSEIMQDIQNIKNLVESLPRRLWAGIDGERNNDAFYQTYHPDADTDADFYFNADPESTFHPDADSAPDPDPSFQ